MSIFYWRRGTEVTTPGTGTGGPCYDISGTIATTGNVTGSIPENIIRLSISDVPLTGLINIQPATGDISDDDSNLTGNVTANQ